MIKDTLTDLGFYVTGPVGTIAQALAILEMDEFDGAILDVNLGGDSVYPVAEGLSARGIPFAFMTGYAQEAIDSRYAHVARLEKPIEPQILRHLFVETVIGGKTLQRQTEAESVTAAVSAV